MESKSKQFQVGDIVVYIGNPAHKIAYGHPHTPRGFGRVIEARPCDLRGWEIKVSNSPTFHTDTYWDPGVFELATNISSLERAIYGI